MLITMARALLGILLLSSLAYAQPYPIPNLQDEGVDQGSYYNLDFTGTGVTASQSGGTATVTIPGRVAGGSNTEIQYNASGTLDGVSTFTTDGTDIDLNAGDFQIHDDDALYFGDDTANDGSIVWSGSGGQLNIDAGTGNLDLNSGAVKIDSNGKQSWYNSSISPTAVVNVNTSSSTLRSALNFNLSFTGGAVVGLNVFSKVTDSTTNGMVYTVAYLGDVFRNIDVSGAQTLYGYWARMGIPTSTILTQGSQSWVGYYVNWGNGKASTSSTSGATIYRSGMMIEDFGTMNGSITDSAFGIQSAEPFLVYDDVPIYLEGSVNTYGDTRFLYNSTDGTIDVYVDNFKQLAIDGTDPSDFSISNLTTDRAYDANATSTAELADVLGTLIDDLRNRIGLQW